MEVAAQEKRPSAQRPRQVPKVRTTGSCQLTMLLTAERQIPSERRSKQQANVAATVLTTINTNMKNT